MLMNTQAKFRRGASRMAIWQKQFCGVSGRDHEVARFFAGPVHC